MVHDPRRNKEHHQPGKGDANAGTPESQTHSANASDHSAKSKEEQKKAARYLQIAYEWCRFTAWRRVFKPIIFSSGIWTAAATVVIAVTTIVYTHYARKQWEVLQRQLEVLQRQLTDDEWKEAAQLSIQDVSVTTVNNPTRKDLVSIQLSYTLKNVGPTTALSLDSGTGEAPDCRITPSYAQIAPNGGNGGNWNIPEGAEEKYTEWLATNIPRKIEDRKMLCFSLIDQYAYYDIFGHVHFIAECFRYTTDLHRLICNPYKREK